MKLPTPEPGQAGAERYVADHLGDLVADDVRGSDSFRGGQSAADQALASVNLVGYAASRNTVSPLRERGSTAISPYVRHGLLTLQQVWDSVDGPPEDRAKFRNELLWQEFARHWYARLGERTREGLVRELAVSDRPSLVDSSALDRSMACLDLVVGELEDEGWMVNQSRLWFASHWSVRSGRSWQEGEDFLFRHLLDGSRAANRLGWQWAVGVGSSQAYNFTRWQVEERAAGLCASCDLVHACPVENWPNEPEYRGTEQPIELRVSSRNGNLTGPSRPVVTGQPDVVWLTAESLGVTDPASAAYPDLPLVFVFDEPLLRNLKLSSKRLVFLVETLAELALSRSLEVYRGAPVDVLNGRSLAVTFAPVPGFTRKARRLAPVSLHPWPWLRHPSDQSLVSFSAWLGGAERVGLDA